jgi:hypothetical protein
LAEQPRLAAATLRDASKELSAYRCADAPDGRWLANVFCGGDTRQDLRRRTTLQLIARVIDTRPVTSLAKDVSMALAFGDFIIPEPFAAAPEEAAIWRGVLLRNYSVGAWRRLWAWLVDQVYSGQATTVDALAEAFADQLPAGSVADMVAGIPELFDAAGNPAPVEVALRAGTGNIPHRELQVLAAGAGRVNRLEGATARAFIRKGHDDLDPTSMQQRLSQAAAQALRDFGIHLVRELVAKSRRVTMSKMVIRDDGTLWIPSRLHIRGDDLVATSREGAGDVSTRLSQLAVVLAACGVFDGSGATWRVTDRGWALLG